MAGLVVLLLLTGCALWGGAPDQDADRLSDADELARGTDPRNADSDGDGSSDGVEVRSETDPLHADVAGQPLRVTTNPFLDTPPPELLCGDGVELKGCFQRVEGGTFRRDDAGTPGIGAHGGPSGTPSEALAESVTVSTFWIQRGLVDTREAMACAGSWCSPELLARGEGATLAGEARADDPWTPVTWFDASRLCARLGARLPTEAEWVYAALALERQGDPPDSPLEWVADWDSPRGSGTSSATDPYGPLEGTKKVLRGGPPIGADATQRRATYRAVEAPDVRRASAGVRCAWGPLR